jgi:porin
MKPFKRTVQHEFLLAFAVAVVCLPSTSNAAEAQADSTQADSSPSQPSAETQPTAEEEGKKPYTQPPFFRLDYSGDFWTSPALTGDWGGKRTELAEKGISINLETLNYGQGNAHGGRSTDDAFRYGGSSDYIIQLDTWRMGLWKGGYFKIRGETRWGHGIDDYVGSVAPTNFDTLLPAPEPNGITTLTEYYMMQFLSEKFGLIAGQVDLTRLPGGNVFYGDPYNQFMNTALWYNMAPFAVVPYAAMTAGAFYMPTKWLSGSTLVVDDLGTPEYSGYASISHSPHAPSIIQNVTLNIKPFNLDGHQRFNFAYSTREHIPLDDLGRLGLAGVLSPRLDPRLNFPPVLRLLGVRRRLPTVLLRAAVSRVIAPQPTNSENWAFWYDFDQYLYQCPNDPEQGFGLFGSFGLTSGAWFPIGEAYVFGLGGKGVIPERPRDRYGVGYYCLNFSNQLPGIFNANVEQGVELFYNIEVTPWLHITPDLQIIADPGGSDRHEVALVYGLRMQVSF